jgi:lipid-A-disaccharide synthase
MAPLVYLIAGEPSGDALGARLIEGLKELTGGELRITGVGGPLMEEQGLESLYPIGALSVIGVVEILTAIPTIYGLINRTVADIRAKRPDVVVTIDSQTFSHWVAKRLHPAPCPIVHYVAPTVWAWKPWRARNLAREVDRVLMLFTFEKPYFDAVGLDGVVVGHPVAAREFPAGAGEQFRAAHGIAPEETVLCLLPGSRTSEVTRLLPIFRDTVEILRAQRPALRLVLPTVPHVEAKVRAAVDAWPAPVIVLADGEDAKYAAFQASDAALAASGTVALELAAAGLPAVITYQAHPITAAIVRRVVRVPYACLVNLIEGREVVPECLQENGTPEKLAETVGRLLDDPAARDAQREAMARVMTALGRGGEPPHLCAARAVLEMIAAKEFSGAEPPH